MGLKHGYKSLKADPADATIIGASKWNADHFYIDASGNPIGNVGALLFSGVAGAITQIDSVAAGQVLASGGAGVPPFWTASPTLTSIVFAGGVTIDGSEIGMLDGVTPGVVVASKVVVVDANKDIASFRNLTASGIITTPIVNGVANVLEMRNGANPQAFYIANTYTDAANYERLLVGAGSGNIFYLATQAAGAGIQTRTLKIGSLSGQGPITFITAAVDRWTISGTGHLIAATDNSYDIGATGATRPRNLFTGGYIIAGGEIQAGSGSAFSWATRSKMYSASDGVIALYNAATNDFGRLQFGGTTNAFPAIKRSAATLYIRLADDSDWATIHAGTIVMNGGGLIVSPSTGYVSIGTNPATTGAIRLANAGPIHARNFANTTNRHLISLNTSDQVFIGETSGPGSVTIPMSGPHSIGGVPDPTIGLRINTTATGTFCCAVQVGGTLTATANGDVLTGFNLGGPSIAKGAFTALSVTGFRLYGSNITASGAGTIGTAATVFIGDAPTIGTTNYSLWVGSGVSRFGGVVEHTNNITFTTNATYAIGTTAAVAAAIYTRLLQTDAGQNLYLAGAAGIYFRINGVDSWAINSAGTLYPVADNTNQLGGSVNRISSGLFGTAVIIGTNPAATGAIRLANNSAIRARNAGNSADVDLIYLDVNNDVIIGTGGIGKYSLAGPALAIGTNPAAFGAIRLPNNQGIWSRNAANTADINTIRVLADNYISIGGTAAGIVCQNQTIPGTTNTIPLGLSYAQWSETYAAKYGSANLTGTLVSNDSQVVQNTFTISLGTNAVAGLLVVVNVTENFQALFFLSGPANATTKVATDTGSGAGFSTVAGTANAINVYWSAANSRYELENRRGGAITLRLIRVGV